MRKVLMLHESPRLNGPLVELLRDLQLELLETADVSTAATTLQAHALDAVFIEMVEGSLDRFIFLQGLAMRRMPVVAIINGERAQWLRQVHQLGVQHFVDRTSFAHGQIANLLPIHEVHAPRTAA